VTLQPLTTLARGDITAALARLRALRSGFIVGAEAMAFLRRKGVHADAPRPELILLDLSMPKMDGREVLAEIKGDESLKLIPTVILTTSDAETDVLKCFELQANSYLLKPVDLTAFEVLVKSINDFWLTKSRLPQRMQSLGA
jgi:CheY-like chemotaxis protein